MHPYKMILYAVETTEGLEYVAEYPILKYAIGSGSTTEGAIAVLNDVTEGLLVSLRDHNLPIPPSDLLIEPDDFSGKVLLRVSKSLHRHMSHKAHEEGVSLNTYMIEALSAYTYADAQAFVSPALKKSWGVHD